MEMPNLITSAERESRIGLIISSSGLPVFARQTPRSSGEWGNWTFHENTPKQNTIYDVVIVYNNLRSPVTVPVRGGTTILVTAEPPSVLRYPKEFLQQFDKIISSQENLAHENVHLSATSLPWHIGLQKKVGLDHVTDGVAPIDYDFLANLKKPNKDRKISIISSAKTITEGHRRRLEFVFALKDEFGDEIDLFGAGIKHVEDKWDALERYEYHIAIENYSMDHYWTEKLSDSILAWAYPVYHGCKNVSEYLPHGAWREINELHINEAKAGIEQLLRYGLKKEEEVALALAREKVLDELNLIPFMSSLLEDDPGFSDLIGGEAKPTKLIGFEPHYGDTELSILARIKRKALRIFNNS